jgi:sugar-specific transcriptional regulator TrmB
LIKTNILEKLRSIGFKENESKVLFVLLQGKPLSASQIAKESGIIRNSIYDILKDFVDKGYCNEIETNTILKYQSIDFQIITDKIEKEFNENNRLRVKTLNETIGEIKKHYESNNGIKERDDKEVNIELIRGYNKHRMEKYIEYLKSSKKRVLGMYRLRGIVSSELDDIAGKFINNGGELRSIYQIGLNFKIIKEGAAVPATREDLILVCENFQSAGEKLRLCDNEIPNMTIFDDEIVFNNITETNIPIHKNADIIIKNKSNAKFMTDLFEYYWDKSITVEQYRKRKLKKV